MEIRGSTAFVTGAAGGIGREFVRVLLERGAVRVYAAGLAAVKAGGWDPRVVPLDLDITNEAAAAEVALKAADVSLLINNAGVNLRAPFIAAPSIASARREIETNYLGTLIMCRAFAPVLAGNGGGAIVNLLSIVAKVTLPNLGSYCASKAALLRLTEGVRAELAEQGTHVLGVMPWAVDTPMSGPFQGEKTSPAEVASGTLDALARGEEDVYFHAFSDNINRRLREDPKALEHEMGATFKRAR